MILSSRDAPLQEVRAALAQLKQSLQDTDGASFDERKDVLVRLAQLIIEELDELSAPLS